MTIRFSKCFSHLFGRPAFIALRQASTHPDRKSRDRPSTSRTVGIYIDNQGFNLPTETLVWVGHLFGGGA